MNGKKLEQETALKKIRFLNEAAKQCAQTRPHKAIDMATEALSLIELHGGKRAAWKPEKMQASRLLAIGHLYLANYKESLQYNEISLKLAVELKDKTAQMLNLKNIGGIFFYLSEYETAMRYWEESLSLSRALRNVAEEANIMNNLASVYDVIGDAEASLALFEEIARLRSPFKDPSEGVMSFSNRGRVLTSLKRYDDARAHYEQALSLARSHRLLKYEAAVLNNLALLCCETNDIQKAEQLELQSMQLRREIDDRFGCLESLAMLCEILVRRLRQTNAQDAVLIERLKPLFAEVLSLADDLNAKNLKAALLHQLAVFHKTLGDYRAAFDAVENSHALEKDVFKEQSLARIRNLQVVHHIELLQREADMREKQNKELMKAHQELQSTLKRVTHLEDVITICAWSGKIQHDGQWIRMEEFFKKTLGVVITHGISEEEAEKLQAKLRSTE